MLLQSPEVHLQWHDAVLLQFPPLRIWDDSGYCMGDCECPGGIHSRLAGASTDKNQPPLFKGMLSASTRAPQPLYWSVFKNQKTE